MTRVGGWVAPVMASPVMRSSVPVLMGVRAAVRSAMLRKGGEAE